MWVGWAFHAKGAGHAIIIYEVSVTLQEKTETCLDGWVGISEGMASNQPKSGSHCGGQRKG